MKDYSGMALTDLWDKIRIHDFEDDIENDQAVNQSPKVFGSNSGSPFQEGSIVDQQEDELIKIQNADVELEIDEKTDNDQEAVEDEEEEMTASPKIKAHKGAQGTVDEKT